MPAKKDHLKELLRDLIRYARAQNITAEFWLHAEHSALVRLANSAISLNTCEDLFELTVTACRGNARGTCTLMIAPGQRERMYEAIRIAGTIAQHATPTSYPRTLTPLTPLPDDDGGFDEALWQLAPQQKLDYIQAAVQGLESTEMVLAGMLSSGAVWEAAANTLNDTVVFHALTDANVSLVLSHAQQRWELQSTQSAACVSELQPAAVHAELELLLHQYRGARPQQLAPGPYEVVFGRDALAELLQMCAWLGFNGGACKRKMTFLKEEHLGTRIFSAQVSISDDPTQRAAFPYAFDVHGVPRTPFPLVTRGVFNAFMWDRDSADEFGQKETGHSVPSLSLALAPGTSPVNSLAALLTMPRERDVLYIPHLHYMNAVNHTEGIITCCSRFGALLLRADGSVAVPFNVRLTEKLGHMFGRVAWLSRETCAANVSGTYGTRTPAACVVPRFMGVHDVAITHVNDSF